MAELILRRKKQIFAPMNCCFRVYIDEQQKTVLQNGQKETLKMQSGTYSIRVQNNYFKSSEKEITVEENDILLVETYGNPLVGWLYILAPALLIIYTTLKMLHVSMPSYASTVALAPLFVFILVLAFVSIFKKGVLVKVS